MTFRVYLMPDAIGVSGPLTGVHTPGRFFELSPRPQDGWFCPYGLEWVWLVIADVTPAQHTALTANADVSSMPANLDANLSAAAVTQIQATLSGLNIPEQWVTTALTYRQVVQRIRRIFEFACDLKNRGGGGRLFPSGVTLATQYNQLTTGQQNALKSAANRYGWDTSSLSGTSTMRQMIHTLIQQWNRGPILMGPETF